jgi:hypothetical protein
MPNPRHSTKKSRLKIVLGCLLLVLLFWLLLNNPIRRVNTSETSSGIANAVANNLPPPSHSEPKSDEYESDGVSGEISSAASRDQGIEIFGKVFLDGKIPAPPKPSNSRNADCEERVLKRRFEVAADRGLANTFVYVKSGLEGTKYPAPVASIEMAETNCWFEPYVIGLQVDQNVLIKNLKIHHHFKIKFDSGREIAWEPKPDGRMEDELEFSFENEDVLSALTCSVHPWEWAHFGVVAHPYFAVTDRAGKFRLPKGLRPGKYVIAARHPYTDEEMVSVAAVKGGKYSLSFHLKAAANADQIPAPTESSETEEGLERPPAQARINLAENIGKPRHEVEQGVSRFGKIVGKVFLKGTPPPEKILPLTSDCQKLHDTPLTTRFYVTDDEKAFADVVVYISSGLRQKTFSPSTNAISLVQNGCEFVPYVFGIQKGQPLLVQNLDSFMHNFHVRSATGSKELNIGLGGGSSYTTKFQETGAFTTIRCDLHPWEFSYAFALDHPFFSVSATNGNFEISNVPPGVYTITAAHRKAGTISKEKVEVSAGVETKLVFTMDAKN